MAFETYTVKSGDTLSGIAKKFGTTVAEILKLNPDITNPDLIKVGQVINIRKQGGGNNVSDFAIVVNVVGGSARSSDSDIKPSKDDKGIYSVSFPVDVSNWLWQATFGAADGTEQLAGSITTELGPMGSPQIVTVRTFDAKGDPVNRPFHLHVRDL